jgi:AcrR family transcriptional regulator
MKQLPQTNFDNVLSKIYEQLVLPTTLVEGLDDIGGSEDELLNKLELGSIDIDEFKDLAGSITNISGMSDGAIVMKVSSILGVDLDVQDGKVSKYNNASSKMGNRGSKGTSASTRPTPPTNKKMSDIIAHFTPDNYNPPAKINTDLVADSGQIADDLDELGHADDKLIELVQHYISNAIETVLDDPEQFREDPDTDLVAHSEHIADDLADIGYEGGRANRLIRLVQHYISNAIETALDAPDEFLF